LFGIKHGYRPYTSQQYKEGSRFTQQYEQGSHARCMILTPFVHWSVRNNTHIVGDYAVFKLGFYFRTKIVLDMIASGEFFRL
jgi:hypothetical protein